MYLGTDTVLVTLSTYTAFASVTINVASLAGRVLVAVTVSVMKTFIAGPSDLVTVTILMMLSLFSTFKSKLADGLETMLTVLRDTFVITAVDVEVLV